MARETQGSPAGEKKLEQYGVWVKVKPREVLPAAADDTFELSDLDAPKAAPAAVPSRGGLAAAASRAAVAVPDEGTLSAEEEDLLDELGSEFGAADAAAQIEVPEEEPLLADAELPEIELSSEEAPEELAEELPALDDEALGPPRAARGDEAVEVTLSEDAQPEERFDDLAALETELASVATTARATASSSSAEVLARIEEELRSIRTDLTQLRSDLSTLRGKAAADREPGDAGGSEARGGFFDEEEDETIALTGDELDNILKTADVTEEAAEAAMADTPETGTGALDLDIEVEAPAPAEAAPEPTEDVLSLETPVLSDDQLPPVEEAADAIELEEETPLPGGDEGLLSDLPAELVLEEPEPGAAPRDAVSDLAAVLDEGIPEIEEAAGDASPPSDETIDLDTLDLGEEPKVIDAVSEQVDDLELEDAQEVEEAEPLAAEDLSVEEAPAAAADEGLSDDIDLEALAIEAEELDDSAPQPPPSPVEDLEAADLEEAEELEPVGAADGIQIPFEEAVPTPSPDLDAKLDQIIEAEEIRDEDLAGGAPAGRPPAGPSGIPEDLRGEIRTVLKYMDQLLEALPEEKITEFAQSEYFVMYKKLFEDLGLEG